MTSTTWHTPAAVAEQLGIAPEKVLAWIRAGELAAVNVAQHQGGRPRWRISAAALEAFLAARQTGPVTRPPRRKKQRRKYYA